MSTSTTYDLRYLRLETGTHTITAKAKADGYFDSAESEAVSYDALPTAKNLYGVWVFNSTLCAVNNYVPYQEVTAVCGDGIITTIRSSFTGDETITLGGIIYDFADGTATWTYDNEKWLDETYRTVEFTTAQTVSENFFAWLTANATYQE